MVTSLDCTPFTTVAVPALTLNVPATAVPFKAILTTLSLTLVIESTVKAVVPGVGTFTWTTASNAKFVAEAGLTDEITFNVLKGDIITVSGGKLSDGCTNVYFYPINIEV